MANLILCPVCNGQLSSSALTCIHCGHPMGKRDLYAISYGGCENMSKQMCFNCINMIEITETDGNYYKCTKGNRKGGFLGLANSFSSW